MATKKRYFGNGNYYHIYNRGVEKRKVFLKEKDAKKLLETVEHCLENSNKPSRRLKNKNVVSEPPLEIIAFCLMPNHFHFLVKQNYENGVTVFFSRLSNSYTKYFNTKYDRVGPLFQGSFKAVTIETDEQILHLSRYIHLNPVVSGLVEDPRAYEWSSFRDYLGQRVGFVQPEIVLSHFPAAEAYESFVLDQVDHGRSLEELKHQLLDPA